MAARAPDRARPGGGNLNAAFNRPVARAHAEWPAIKPRDLPPGVAGATNHDRPLNAFQHDIVELAIAIAGDSPLHPNDVVTVLDAIHAMRSKLGRQERAVKK